MIRKLIIALALCLGAATAQAACPSGNTGPCEPWSTGNQAATDIGTLTDAAKFGLSIGSAQWRTTTGLEILSYLEGKNWAFSGTLSGSGLSDYLASPPAIGGTAPAAGSFTSLGASGSVTLSGLSTGTQLYCVGLSSGNALVLSSGACGGSGGVTSVGLSLPSIFTVSGSPVTGSGTLTGTFATQSANTVLAGPSSGSAAAPTFRSLVGADLPNPSASTLGGIESFASVTHKWVDAISTSGVPSATQPACADISDAAASCATDATDASNISSGTLGLPRLGASYTNGQVLIGSTSDGELHAATLTAGSNVTITDGGGSITIAASGGGGSGCTTSGSSGNVLTDNGAGGCSSDTATSLTNGALSLGSSGTAGSVALGNATSGTITVQPVTGALGAAILSLPAATDTLVGRATTDTLTNKSIAASEVNSGTLAIAQGGTGASSLAGADIPVQTGTIATGNCVKWASATSITDNGAPCTGAPIVAESSDYTANCATDFTILADTSGGSITITLPASPPQGCILNIKKVTTDGNTLTIANNGNDIEGSASSLTTSATNRPSYELHFNGTGSDLGWWQI